MVVVEPGQSIELVAYALDINGIVVPGVPLEWDLGNANIGTMYPSGEFTANRLMGDFPQAIRVSIGGPSSVSSSIDVRIQSPQEIPNDVYITVLPQVVSLNPGQEVQFSAVTLNAEGENVSIGKILWHLDSSESGTISSDGRFRAGVIPGIYRGAVSIQVTLNEYRDADLVQKAATVIVSEGPQDDEILTDVINASIFPNRIDLSPGEAATFFATVTDDYGRALPSYNIDWSVKEPRLGQITNSGRLSAGISPGIYPGGVAARISVETPSGIVRLEVNATLVIRGPLDHVIISPASTEVVEGGTIQFTATAYDENSVRLPNAIFNWAILDPSVGVINDRGLFEAKGRPGEYHGAVIVQAIQDQNI